MRLNKYAVYVTMAITIISFIICFMLREAKSFLYDLSMACFGSALLGLVMSYIAYLAVRREAMESFWQEGIDLVSALRKISYLDIEEPEELVIEALKMR